MTTARESRGTRSALDAAESTLDVLPAPGQDATARRLRFTPVIAAIVEALLTLWLLATLCFVLLHAAPGGPFDNERALQPELAASLAARYRLDESLPTQYVHHLGDLVRGDLGPSFQYPDYSVNELIALGLPVTLVTGAAALVLAFGLGIPVGLIAGWRPRTIAARAAGAASALGLALPKFVVAPVLVLVFAVLLGWFPAGGWDWRAPSHAVLPVLALALPNFAVVVRLTRDSLREVLATDYIRAARCRGITPRRLLTHHALRPTLLPVLAWLAPALIAVLTGSVVVEQVFGIPGMGRYFVQGALNRDYTLVSGVAVVAGALIVAVNLAVDALMLWLDPRLRR